MNLKSIILATTIIAMPALGFAGLGAAHASVFQYNLAGTISGTDSAGLFGTPGQVLTNAQYRFSSSLDAANLTSPAALNSGNHTYYWSGNLTTGVMTASLTVGSVTLDLSMALTASGITNGATNNQFQTGPTGLAMYNVFDGHTASGQHFSISTGQRNDTQSYGAILDSFTQSLGGTVICGTCYLNFSASAGNGISANESLYGGMTKFGINQEIPSVPEPASMALLGAGLLGLTAARRRRT